MNDSDTCAPVPGQQQPDPAPAPATANEHLAHAPVANGQTLSDSVAIALANYFERLDGQPVTDVYQMVLSEIEAPLLEQVLKYAGDNQTRAAQMLGLNRGTLRKKMKLYGLL